MSARQGSASFTIVLGGLTAVLVGAIILTFLVYPMFNAFTDAAFWSASTDPGSRLVSVTEGVWTFTGGIMLLTILSWVWVSTRQ